MDQRTVLKQGATFLVQMSHDGLWRQFYKKTHYRLVNVQTGKIEETQSPAIRRDLSELLKIAAHKPYTVVEEFTAWVFDELEEQL